MLEDATKYENKKAYEDYVDAATKRIKDRNLNGQLEIAFSEKCNLGIYEVGLPWEFGMAKTHQALTLVQGCSCTVCVAEETREVLDRIGCITWQEALGSTEFLK